MPSALASTAAPPTPRPAAASTDSRARLATWVVLLVLGLRFNVDITGGVSFGVTLAYLLPLLAAWWATRDGLAVVVPLALLSLVPDVSYRLGFVTWAFGYSATACLVALGVAIAAAPQDAAARLMPWARWRWLGQVALVLWVACAVQRMLQDMRGDAMAISIDPVAVLALLVSLAAVDGRRLAAVIGMPRAGFVALCGLVLLALAVNVRVFDAGLSVRLGWASAAFVLPAAVFVAVLCGWVVWWRVLLLVAALALLEQLALMTVGPSADWLLDVRGRPQPLNLLTEACIAALLGSVFMQERSSAAASSMPAMRPALALPLVLLGLLAVLPILSLGIVPTWGTALWAQAGLAFLGGRRLGGRGAVGVPLALLGATAALAVGIDPQLNKSALASSLPSLAGICFAYGLAGALVRRRHEAARMAMRSTGAPVAIDGTAVAEVVQLIDLSATLRAFGALLVPAIVIWEWAGLGVVFGFGLHAADDPDAVVGWFVFAVAAALAALWPLSFVVMDWLNRQDRYRVLSAMTGGLLAWLGVALPTLGLGALLPPLLEDAPAAARAGVTALFAVGVAAACCWLRGRDGVWPRATLALTALFALGVAALLVALGVMLAQAETDLMSWLQLLAAVLGVAALGFLWVRAVRLRLILAEDHPRALLFGALPPGHLWVRMGALLGLPSSMWSSAVFRRPAAWCILLARPLAYAGAAALKLSLPLAIVVIAAGHGLFVLGKRLAAAQPWRPDADTADARAPVLFLRSFEDDQFEFRRPAWQLHLRWFDLWSFRRNLDEAMVDEVALYGPVVALGRPDDKRAPFGASRHWASHETWQELVTRTARRARAIVLAAGESPGLRWEFDLLRREQLVERTVLLLHPDPARADSNRRALLWLLGDEAQVDRLLAAGAGLPVALWHAPDGPHLLRVAEPSAAAYLVALRAHFQRIGPQAVGSALS